MITISIDGPTPVDPDLRSGSHLILERADGRSVWRQRLRVARVIPVQGGTHYSLLPVGDTDGY